MYENLKAELGKNDITQKAIADYLGIHENSISYKLSVGSFTIEEAFKIKERFFPNYELRYLFKRVAQSA